MNIFVSAQDEDFLRLVKQNLDETDELQVLPSQANAVARLLEGGFRSVPSILLVDMSRLAATVAEGGAASLPELYLIALLASPGERERALELGAHDYLVLPVSQRGVRQRLEAARSITLMRLAGHRIQRSSRAIVFGRLVPYIIHSINNPLQTIQGALSLAAEENEPGEDLKKYLQLAGEQTERVIAQIGKLRQWVRAAPSQAQSIDPQTLFTGLEEVLEGYLKNRNIALEFGLFEDHPSMRVDPDLVSIYLLNLLVDLAEALDPESGARITLTGKGHDGRAMLQVRIEPLPSPDGKSASDPTLVAQVLREFCCAQAVLMGAEAEYDPGALSLRLHVPAQE
ncbi:MAG: histidine kinase dimerization/phospho-acceptor domain-containing protein [Chloroflexota bacterium]